MKQRAWISLVAGAAVAVVFIFGIAAAHPKVSFAQESWTINAFDAQLTILESGQLEVVEEIAADFKDIEKHGIYRDLPEVYQQEDGTEYYTEIEVADVTMDGSDVEYNVSRNDANMRIRIGDPDRTIAGPHLYRIHYFATGVLLGFEDRDELYWDVTGNGWDAPILRSSAEVRLPREGIVGTSCYVGGYGDDSPCDENSSATSTATFTHDHALEAGEGLTIAVGYEKGMVPLLTVAAPVTLADILATSVIPHIAFILTLLLGIFLLVMLWRRKGRDKMMRAYETIVVEYESPDNLRPGELGVLMDESADTLDVSATVVDLAVRGYLEIKEIPKGGFFSSADYELTRKKEIDDSLMEYEKILLRGLFENGEVVKLSDLKQKFYTTLAKIKKELYVHVVAKKMFTGNPSTVRIKHGVLAVLVMIAGVFIFMQSIPAVFSDTARALFAGIGPALSITGFIYFIMAIKALPQRTAEGRELFRKGRGYKEFITHVETYRQRFFERENIFMEVLPYAMIFGATEKLAKAMKDMGITPPTPTWYHGVNAFNVATFSHSLSSFSSSLSSTMASAPSSSGSGGGGFSGGGGGGGGGGSW